MDISYEYYLNNIDENLWCSIEKGPYHADVVEVVGTAAQRKSIIANKVKSQANDKRCIQELRGSLPLGDYNYIYCCKNA